MMLQSWGQCRSSEVILCGYFWETVDLSGMQKSYAREENRLIKNDK